jgi:hypothetical protein
MNIGDRVEIVSMPKALPEGLGTRELFKACVGRVFPIIDIKGDLLRASCRQSSWRAQLYALYLDRTRLRSACLRRMIGGGGCHARCADAMAGCPHRLPRGIGRRDGAKAIVDLIEAYEALFLSLTYFIRLDTLLETDHIN